MFVSCRHWVRVPLKFFAGVDACLLCKAHASIAASHMAAGKSARKVIMKERNTTLETTDHNNRNNSENIKETPDERIPGKLIGAIVAVGSLAFIGILTETVMTVLFPQLMREFNVNTATVQHHHHLPADGRSHHAAVVVS